MHRSKRSRRLKLHDNIMVIIVIILYSIDSYIMENGNVSNIFPKVILCETHIGCRHK